MIPAFVSTTEKEGREWLDVAETLPQVGSSQIRLKSGRWEMDFGVHMSGTKDQLGPVCILESNRNDVISCNIHIVHTHICIYIYTIIYICTYVICTYVLYNNIYIYT